MKEKLKNFGFTYFSSPKSLLNTHLYEWLPAIKQLGASSLIFQSNFNRAIPEDPFLIAMEYGLNPVVHFSAELPKARDFNQVSVLFDAYAKRGVDKVILGNRPNVKAGWPSAGWQYENLVEQFLDRFIPFAQYAVQLGIKPVLPPLQPGGDYWDTSFMTLVFSGLKNRQMDSIINQMIISSFGYTFGKPLSWGKGGPERWSGSKPYHTPDGQEDQLGFHNFEWSQSVAERVLGRSVPVIILDAGFARATTTPQETEKTLKNIKLIHKAISKSQDGEDTGDGIKFNPLMQGCYFSLDKIDALMQRELSVESLFEIFGHPQESKGASGIKFENQKTIAHYLLLPSHANSVSDAILNKVKPIIKKQRPTIGFSLVEASFAEQVSIYPDPILFTEEKINQLRASGCSVEVLPESGMEIATKLQGS